MKDQLWHGIRDWGTKSTLWKKTVFIELDSEEIQSEVERYDKMANMCAISLAENPLTGIFKTAVEELKSTLPVVLSFRDESL